MYFSKAINLDAVDANIFFCIPLSRRLSLPVWTTEPDDHQGVSPYRLPRDSTTSVYSHRVLVNQTQRRHTLHSPQRHTSRPWRPIAARSVLRILDTILPQASGSLGVRCAVCQLDCDSGRTLWLFSESSRPEHCRRKRLLPLDVWPNSRSVSLSCHGYVLLIIP
jgi:hypothetical protein